jgi:hypothetical protein
MRGARYVRLIPWILHSGSEQYFPVRPCLAVLSLLTCSAYSILSLTVSSTEFRVHQSSAEFSIRNASGFSRKKKHLFINTSVFRGIKEPLP